MKQWWLSRSPQDKLALMVGLTAVTLLLLYLLFWLPFQKQVEKKQLQVQNQRTTLSWMKQNAAEVNALKGKLPVTSNATSNQALLTLVDKTAKQIQLRKFIQRLKPQGSDAVQLWIEQVPFDTLVQWLDLLVKQHSIRLESVNIERQENKGVVNARLNLQRRPS
jgi:general secretion pathway protein M